MNQVADVVQEAPKRSGLVLRIAEKFGVDGDKMLATLKATAFKQGNNQEVTNEQMMALLVVADQYGLNPFTRELFAFPDKGGIVPVVSVDGWARIVNMHPNFDGVRFLFDPEQESMTCIMYRADRHHAIEVTEYMKECKRSTAPWQSHPRRMLRHKAFIQCARIAFGFSGIFDEDEAQRIIEKELNPRPDDKARVDEVSSRLRGTGQVIETKATMDVPSEAAADTSTGELFVETTTATVAEAGGE